MYLSSQSADLNKKPCQIFTLYGMLTSAVSSKASSASEHWHMGGNISVCYSSPSAIQRVHTLGHMRTTLQTYLYIEGEAWQEPLQENGEYIIIKKGVGGSPDKFFMW